VSRPSRRRFLIGLLAVAAAAAGAKAVGAFSSAASRLRPRASGRSTTRCAQCGSTGHAMLDPACPAAPEVDPR
jgi:hypothetical protein